MYSLKKKKNYICLLKKNIISIRATGVILVIKRNSNKNSGRMKLLTIFDHRVFAKEMKMGNIKTNTSLRVSSRKKKDLRNYLEKNIVIQLTVVILSWINVHCSTKRRNIYCFILYYFLFTFALKVCYLKMDC